MKKLIIALLSFAAIGCQSREVMITPTTEVAPEGAKIEGLRYYPGISIGLRMENYEQYLEQIAAAGFKYIEISIAHKSGLAQMSDEEAIALLTTKRNQAAAAGLTVWSMHLPFEDTVWTNIGGEESKSGFRADEVFQILEELPHFPHLRVRGLMAIPPVSENPGDNLKFFKEISNLSVDISKKKYDNVAMECLSMGMSDDFADAIAAGSTMIRIGTAIFGRRNYAKPQQEN